jgi:hypothetical protein
MTTNNYPIQLSNILNDNDYIVLNEELGKYSTWGLINKPYSNDGIKKFWSTMKWDTQTLTLFNISTIINLKIKKYLKKNIRLCNIHINGQTSCQESEFHTDFIMDDVWTFVLFCGWGWNINWRGEFICQNPETKAYHYVPFIPNTGVLIPSNWQHLGTAPNTNTDKFRVSVAFCYCLSEKFEELILKYPSQISYR